MHFKATGVNQGTPFVRSWKRPSVLLLSEGGVLAERSQNGRAGSLPERARETPQGQPPEADCKLYRFEARGPKHSLCGCKIMGADRIPRRGSLG